MRAPLRGRQRWGEGVGQAGGHEVGRRFGVVF